MSKSESIKKLRDEYALSSEEINMVFQAAMLMPEDPDGCWSILADYGVEVEFDAIADVCHLYS